MKTLPYIIAAAGTGDVKSIVMDFLIILLVIVVIGGLYMGIERFFGPFPPPVRLVVGLLMLIFLVLWALNRFV